MVKIIINSFEIKEIQIIKVIILPRLGFCPAGALAIAVFYICLYFFRAKSSSTASTYYNIILPWLRKSRRDGRTNVDVLYTRVGPITETLML